MSNGEQIKHLDLIQSIIGRMANNSFLIKGWTITISLAGFGFYVNKKDNAFLLLILFSTLIFWVLDAYYVSAERAFRLLYKDLSHRKKYAELSKTNLLNIDIKKYHQYGRDIPRAMFSFPTNLIYLSILLITLTVFYASACLGR